MAVRGPRWAPWHGHPLVLSRRGSLDASREGRSASDVRRVMNRRAFTTGGPWPARSTCRDGPSPFPRARNSGSTSRACSSSPTDASPTWRGEGDLRELRDVRWCFAPRPSATGRPSRARRHGGPQRLGRGQGKASPASGSGAMAKVPPQRRQRRWRRCCATTTGNRSSGWCCWRSG